MRTSASYPIGKFEILRSLSAEEKQKAIETIANFPAELENVLANFTEADLQKTYRDGGWTVRQIVHHCADSHMNAYIRFKLALTENNASILGYNQDAWAELEDVKTVDIEYSVMLLKGLHKRWEVLLMSFSDDNWQRTYFHPEWNKTWTLEEALAQYDWHCRHHFAHVRNALGA